MSGYAIPPETRMRDCRVVDADERDIPREMLTLNAAITDAAKVVDALEARLHPILRLEPTAVPQGPQTTPSSPCCSPHSVGLWDLRQMVNNLTRRVEGLLERVQF